VLKRPEILGTKYSPMFWDKGGLISRNTRKLNAFEAK
jgi:hypothetical protein